MKGTGEEWVIDRDDKERRWTPKEKSAGPESFTNVFSGVDSPRRDGEAAEDYGNQYGTRADDVLANDRKGGGGRMNGCIDKKEAMVVTIPSPSCSAGSICLCSTLRRWRRMGTRLWRQALRCM
jgi:hypothetical protein